MLISTKHDRFSKYDITGALIKDMRFEAFSFNLQVDPNVEDAN